MSTDPFGDSVPDGSRDLPWVLLCAAWMSYIILSRLCYLVLVGLNKVRWDANKIMYCCSMASDCFLYLCLGLN